MIAELGMYDWPQERDSLDRLWGVMSAALEGAPAALTRTHPEGAAWTRPDLFLGQTCGLPYRARLHGRVGLIGAFDFGLPGTPPGHYHSVIVVPATRRGDDLRDFAGQVLALNSFDSQSGWAAIAGCALRAGLRFGDHMLTGAHAQSARAVAEGRADIAAIDAVTWRLVLRHMGDVARRLRVLARTPPAPGLPLITAPGRDTQRMAAALVRALETPPPTGALGVAGFVAFSPSAYLAVPMPPARAVVLDRADRAAMPKN